MFSQVHLKIREVRFWHWNHFWNASILLVILPYSIQNQEFHVQSTMFRKMRQLFLSPGEFCLAFYTVFYDKKDIPAGWFWKRQFFTGFNETISTFRQFFETTRKVSLNPGLFWHFFWNHPAVLGGFRAKIWPKITKSKVSKKADLLQCFWKFDFRFSITY